MQDEKEPTAERLRRQSSILAEFGLLAFRSDDLDEILHRAAELVAGGLDVRRAKVLELLPGGTELLVRAGVNWDPGVVGGVTFGADRDSPAGYALSHDEPVVSSDLDSETRFRIPDVLRQHGIKSMVNVIIVGESGPFGVLEVDASRHIEFSEDDIAFLKNYANLLAAAVDRHRAHAALGQALSEQKVLVQELEHRVKNMLGLVQSIAAQTTADEPAARAFRDIFLGRLQALAEAENLVFDDHDQEVELRRLVEVSIKPFEGSLLSINGPSLRLPARAGRVLALVLHELGTNATKHGALSVPDGKAQLTWGIEERGGSRQVRLSWRETGGPGVRPPDRRGFGTRLLTRLAAYELDGETQLDHAQEGLRYEITFPVEVT